MYATASTGRNGTADGDSGWTKDSEDIVPEELAEVARMFRATQNEERVGNDDRVLKDSGKGDTTREIEPSYIPTGVSASGETDEIVACLRSGNSAVDI